MTGSFEDVYQSDCWKMNLQKPSENFSEKTSENPLKSKLFQVCKNLFWAIGNFTTMVSRALWIVQHSSGQFKQDFCQEKLTSSPSFAFKYLNFFVKSSHITPLSLPTTVPSSKT